MLWFFFLKVRCFLGRTTKLSGTKIITDWVAYKNIIGLLMNMFLYTLRNRWTSAKMSELLGDHCFSPWWSNPTCLTVFIFHYVSVITNLFSYSKVSHSTRERSDYPSVSSGQDLDTVSPGSWPHIRRIENKALQLSNDSKANFIQKQIRRTD